MKIRQAVKISKKVYNNSSTSISVLHKYKPLQLHKTYSRLIQYLHNTKSGLKKNSFYKEAEYRAIQSYLPLA